jgi:tRNA(Ser,Leu) C12 N-acetylase TAN1
MRVQLPHHKVEEFRESLEEFYPEVESKEVWTSDFYTTLSFEGIKDEEEEMEVYHLAEGLL